MVSHRDKHKCTQFSSALALWLPCLLSHRCHLLKHRTLINKLSTGARSSFPPHLPPTRPSSHKRALDHATAATPPPPQYPLTAKCPNPKIYTFLLINALIPKKVNTSHTALFPKHKYTLLTAKYIKLTNKYPFYC